MLDEIFFFDLYNYGLFVVIKYNALSTRNYKSRHRGKQSYDDDGFAVMAIYTIYDT